MVMKECWECKKTKELKHFRRGVSIWCRDCCAYRRNDPAAFCRDGQYYLPGFSSWTGNGQRRQSIAKNYGTTEKWIDWLWWLQSGICAICERRVKLVIDHDHASGLVRGLLCAKCNIRLGKMRDKPSEHLPAFVKYLASPPAQRIL